MTKKLIAVEEELLPQIRELAKGDSLTPTTVEVTPDTVVVFNVKEMVKAVGKVQASTVIRRFAATMRESLKNELGVDVPVVCVTEEDELRALPPDFMMQYGWIYIPKGGVEDPRARSDLAKFVIDRLNGQEQEG